MKKLWNFLTGTVAGICLALSLSALAIIGGGIAAHNHSGGTQGGATLQSTTLNNPTINGATWSGATNINSVSAPFYLSFNGNQQVRIDNGNTSGNSGNWLTLQGANTGNSPAIGATGNDANIGIRLVPAGTGAVTIVGASLTSTKACAAQFTRFGPNMCMATTPQAPTTINAACTSVPVPTGSAAVALIVQMNVSVQSQNAIGNDSTSIANWDTSACASNLLVQYVFLTREFVATAATQIASSTFGTITPVFSGNSYFTKSGTTGGTAGVQVIGYYD